VNHPQALTFTSEMPPVEAVAVGPDAPVWSNPIFENAVEVTAIHSGSVIPSEFEFPELQPEVELAYRREKDWGADLVAEAMARYLGLAHYHRVNIARVLVDFGRFPGATSPTAGHMERYALSGLYSRSLGRIAQRQVLEQCYDPISDYMEQLIWPPSNTNEGRQNLMVSLHTYDTHNPTPPYTERPHISVIHTPIGYNRDKRMPFHVFDPLFPPHFGESTADPKLVSRLALTMSALTRDVYPPILRDAPGFRLRVGLNHPYELPDGSLEVRSQVWNFFRWLRKDFESSPDGSDTTEDPAYGLVWKMFLDTNLRDSETVALRSFIHMFRRGGIGHLPSAPNTTFTEVLAAYEHIERYAHSPTVIDRFRHDPCRLSTLVIEVRKDLVWEHTLGHPVADRSGAKLENIDFIGRHLAEAISSYIDKDALSNNNWDGIR
jgi:predicted N-formylglutamate amidohydrolase